MDVVRLNDATIEIDGVARVERGPLLKTAIASEELFASGELADHYAVGRPDKMGEIIVLGQEFQYLDWKGPPVFHYYELCVEEWTESPDPAWRRRGYRETEAEAVAVAAGIAAAQGA